MTTQLTSFGPKLDQQTRGKDWQSAHTAIKQATQNGDLPEFFNTAVDHVDRAYKGLDTGDQTELVNLSDDTRQALYMLAASIGQNDNRPSTVNAIQRLVSSMGSQIVSG